VCVILLCTVLVQGQILYTTPYIDQVFKGKCLSKAALSTSPVVTSFASVEAYCEELWARFNDTASLPSYEQTNITWAPFFDISDFSTPKDNAMLWSGSYTFSQTLLYKYTTLEETLTGYIINGLWWCPADVINEPFNTTAPCAFNDSPPSGYYGLAPVWREASRRFAAGITGEVTVLLQSRFDYASPNALPVTFRSDSIFATVELPTLDPNAVTNLVVLYLPGDRQYFGIENCNNGTLLALRQAVTAKFTDYATQYYCFDDIKLIVKLCSNKTNEEIESIVAGANSLSFLQSFAATFDFTIARDQPECAAGLLAYFAGVGDEESVQIPTHISSSATLSIHFAVFVLLFIGMLL